MDIVPQNGARTRAAGLLLQCALALSLTFSTCRVNQQSLPAPPPNHVSHLLPPSIAFPTRSAGSRPLSRSLLDSLPPGEDEALFLGEGRGCFLPGAHPTCRGPVTISASFHKQCGDSSGTSEASSHRVGPSPECPGPASLAPNGTQT